MKQRIHSCIYCLTFHYYNRLMWNFLYLHSWPAAVLSVFVFWSWLFCFCLVNVSDFILKERKLHIRIGVYAVVFPVVASLLSQKISHLLIQARIGVSFTTFTKCVTYQTMTYDWETMIFYLCQIQKETLIGQNLVLTLIRRADRPLHVQKFFKLSALSCLY